jgi:hypothetical protein
MIFFFAPKMMIMPIAINLADLVVCFPWPRSTPESEFPIKSYGRLKLRLSNFGFYFFYLISSFFFFSLFVSLISFLYMKTDENELVIRGCSIFEFLFLDLWFGMNEQWDEKFVRANVIDEMRYIRFFLRMNLC